MLKQIYLGLGLSLLLSSQLAMAADKAGKYASYASSCSNIIQGQKDADSGRSEITRDFLSTWLSGYITATNSTLADTYNILGSSDLKGAVLWVEKWCAENPLKRASDAAEALVLELHPSRKTAR